MKEDLLHYVWKYKLFQSDKLQTTDGVSVEVLHTGLHNTNAGPDFLDARLKIGDTLWAGSVEIHVRATDWTRHGHQHDAAYNNVVLQVVADADATAVRQNGELVPNLVLHFDERYRTNYDTLMRQQAWVACESFLPTIDPLTKRFWFEKLSVMRIEHKATDLELLLTQTVGDWEEAFYQFVARSFGFGVNTEAFELLARSLPQRILAKHKDSLLQIEALLFGQAGFLELEPEDDYQTQLKTEYAFLKTKYGLSPLERSLWKYLRLRPVNFPTVRIAQFAALVQGAKHLLARVLDADSETDLLHLLSATPSEYWKTHYQFAKPTKARVKTLGADAIRLVVINAVVPTLMLYGRHMNETRYLKRALALLEHLPAETNSIVTRWKELGLEAKSAYDSQALIELKKNYCDRNACLDCALGHKIVAQ